MPRAMDLGFDLRAGSLDQAAVLHTRRAGRFTGSARQAQVQMLNVGGVDLGLPGGHLHHLVDAAARRVHLDAKLAVGGAVVQAEAAMHTPVEVHLAGRVLHVVEIRCGHTTYLDSTRAWDRTTASLFA